MSQISSDYENSAPSDGKAKLYPKPLPVLQPGPILDDFGFTFTERVALRQAWSVIKHFARRYGKDIFYTYLTENHQSIETFRNRYNILELSRLHEHAVLMMRFMGKMIEEDLGQDSTFFTAMVTDTNCAHNQCSVPKNEIFSLANAIVQYVLCVLKDVSSPSLENGLNRLVHKLQMYYAHHSLLRGDVDNKTSRSETRITTNFAKSLSVLPSIEKA